MCELIEAKLLKILVFGCISTTLIFETVTDNSVYSLVDHDFFHAECLLTDLTRDHQVNSVFTLPDTNTDTDTETDKLQQYSMALLSPCSVNTSAQYFTTHFLLVSVSVSVLGNVNTP